MSKTQTDTQIIYRVQKVIAHKDRAKITLPSFVKKKWGYPKHVLVIYDPEKDELIIKRYKKPA